jgi:uncharacterized linocin/CFP29 family protein
MVNILDAFTKEMDNELVDPLRQVLKGRKLVHTTPEKGFHVSSVDWGKMVEISEGKVSYGFTSGNEDFINVGLTNSRVPVYWKDYRVDRRIYEGWLSKNTDMDASTAIAAAFMAAKAEDYAIVRGILGNDGSTYEVNGLYEGAGCDFTTTCDFGTPGKATEALSGAYQKMDEKDVPVDSLPFNMALSSVQYQQLMSSRFTTSNQRELPDILDMLNGGAVFSLGSSLTAGTGMVLPTADVGAPYLDFYLTSDFKTEHGINSEHPDTGDLNGRAYLAGILRIKQSYVICKMSSI